jgi:hypothetical protein
MLMSVQCPFLQSFVVVYKQDLSRRQNQQREPSEYIFREAVQAPDFFLT